MAACRSESGSGIVQLALAKLSPTADDYAFLPEHLDEVVQGETFRKVRETGLIVVRYAVPWYCCCAVRCTMVLYAVPLVSSLWLQGSVYLISMVPLQPWCIYRAPHSIVSQSIIIHNMFA